MNVELRWLRSFLAVAEEMHFGRAARRLNLAQAALTAQIRHLEESVGARLFVGEGRLGWSGSAVDDSWPRASHASEVSTVAPAT